MKKLILFFIATIFIIPAVRADEGMWLLPLIEKLNYADMQKRGLKLSAEEIYNINRSSLKDAVVIFGGGCTGEIISPDGLLLTNHHCGYGAIQQHSSVEHDYLKDGFWAKTRADEIPTPGLSVTFLERIEDISARILPALDTVADEQSRNKKIDAISKTITDEITKGQPNIRARIYSMFSGNAYYLFVYKVYEDIRMVGAPPSSIGKFGADTDNWMWPRHTGDFSIFRVYTDKNGNPAKHAPDNIPMKAKTYFKISLAGFNEGDFAMIVGYPGSTSRYMTSWEVKERMNAVNAPRIYVRGIRQEIMLEDMLADPKVKIQYASKYSGSTNYWKNSIGMNEALKRLKVIEQKEAMEKRFAEFAAADNSENFKTALNDIRTAVEGREKEYTVMQYFLEVFRSIEIHNIAGHAIPYFKALQGTDKQAAANVKEHLFRIADDFYKNYNAPTDVKVAKAMLKVFTEKVNRSYWPQALLDADKKYKGNFAKYVDDMFAKSIFTDCGKLKTAIDKIAAQQASVPDGQPLMPKASIINPLLSDPAFNLALAGQEKANAIGTGIQTYALQLSKGRRHFMEGLIQMNKDKQAFYPDANFSARLTYGNILSYNPKDAVHYKYYTTLDGVMEKEAPDNWEFVVPEKLKQLYQSKDYGRYALPDGDMPVCFLSNNDITGGNSGSPVLNSRGELIGTAFDGNWEALSGDIVFEPELQRCINVDIRYVLFIIDKFADAKHLIEEMTIVE
ncbi:MAG: S46 family peptidase [Prevotellaceae bacterium]|jgi:uncharacterized protein (UPF0254 family)|nr:S46 family peptidase [Prevotellaceae bacterium]